MRGLVVSDKTTRVFNFHEETVKSLVELLAAAGLEKPEDMNRSLINRRVSMNTILRYDEIYPYSQKIKENDAKNPSDSVS